MSRRISSMTNYFPANEQASSYTGDPLLLAPRLQNVDLPLYDDAPLGFPPPAPSAVPLPLSPTGGLAYPNDLDPEPDVEIIRGSAGYKVSAVMRNTHLDLLDQIGQRLERDRLDESVNKHVAKLNLRISHRSDGQRNGYYEFCRVIRWALQHSRQHLTSITVSLPSNFPSHISATSDDFPLNVGPSLRTFEWRGRPDLLPNPLDKIQFTCLENLSLTHCRLSIPDCLEILRNAPTIKVFRLNELAHATSIFANDNAHQTKIVLTRLESLFLGSSINLDALFAAIEVHQLSRARLSFSSVDAVNIPFQSIPWPNMTSFALDAPLTDDETILANLSSCDINSTMIVLLNGSEYHI